MLHKIQSKIYSSHPPALSKINGKRYLVTTGKKGKWQEVSESITFEQVMDNWVRPKVKVTDTNKVMKGVKQFQVKNSKGDGHYTVMIKDGNWSCGCAGYGYRRKCRHIEECKKKL